MEKGPDWIWFSCGPTRLPHHTSNLGHQLQLWPIVFCQSPRSEQGRFLGTQMKLNFNQIEKLNYLNLKQSSQHLLTHTLWRASGIWKACKLSVMNTEHELTPNIEYEIWIWSISELRPLTCKPHTLQLVTAPSPTKAKDNLAEAVSSNFSLNSLQTHCHAQHYCTHTWGSD